MEERERERGKGLGPPLFVAVVVFLSASASKAPHKLLNRLKLSKTGKLRPGGPYEAREASLVRPAELKIILINPKNRQFQYGFGKFAACDPDPKKKPQKERQDSTLPPGTSTKRRTEGERVGHQASLDDPK